MFSWIRVNKLVNNLLTVVDKVLSNTLIVFCRNVSSTFFQQKISMYLPYFKLITLLSFEQLGPGV